MDNNSKINSLVEEFLLKLMVGVPLADIEEMRKELLERCKPWFGFLPDGQFYEEPSKWGTDRTSDDLGRASSVRAFIAWETEQRRKEAANADKL